MWYAKQKLWDDVTPELYESLVDGLPVTQVNKLLEGWISEELAMQLCGLGSVEMLVLGIWIASSESLHLKMRQWVSYGVVNTTYMCDYDIDVVVWSS